MAEGTQSFTGLLFSNLAITDTKLGTGSDANVYLAERKGTQCAAKRLHDILLEDDTPGGALRLISNFEAECTTWSKLRHPCIVQFFGVQFEQSSRLPILVMEKMDISLRKYLEDRTKEDFPLQLKAFVLRQVTQALAYLHGQQPPLVHHDLSTNNVLLNVQSFTAKVSDFGMSQAIQPFSFSRKSSIKGTPAFMPPEALHDPPRYNESLDVFSFGNVIISTVTHKWPNPGPPTLFEGGKLVAVTEPQRRERYTTLFTPEEKDLFLHTVHQCLDNDPDKRPTSVQLVGGLQQIEASLPKSCYDVSTIAQLQQQLAAKVEECRQKDEAFRKCDAALSKSLKENEELVRQMAKIEPMLEDVQSAFVRYGIEVGSWEDVPQAVQQLAHKHAEEPQPNAILKNASSSDFLLVLDTAQIMQADVESWKDLAGHLNCSADYIRKMNEGWISFPGTNSQSSRAKFNKQCTIQVVGDWAAKKEGTGNRPRTLKTILEVVKRCCVHSKAALARLSHYESKLIHGDDLHQAAVCPKTPGP